MKLLTRSAFLLSLLAGLCVLCLAQDNRTSDEPSPPPPPALEYRQDNWKEFSPSEGGYSVLMPGTPELAIEQEQLAFGKFQQRFHHLQTGTGDYTIGYFDLMAELSDSKSSKSLLDAGRTQMFTTNNNWKLLNERDYRIEGSRGRELLIKDGDIILRRRHFLIGSRYYQITLTVSRLVAFQTGKPSSNPSDFTEFYQLIVTRFFDSFKLTPIIAAAANENGTTGENQKGIIRSGVITGKAINLPQPSYPASANSAGVEGSVAVEVLIDEDGKVIEAKAISGPPVLRGAAEDAARRARFTPIRLEGVPVKITGIINYNFRLH